MARSSIIASTGAVPLSDAGHLHRPEPNLWLPPPPHWCPYRLHTRGAHCILGGMFRVTFPFARWISLSFRGVGLNSSLVPPSHSALSCGVCVYLLTCFFFKSLLAGFSHLVHVQALHPFRHVSNKRVPRESTVQPANGLLAGGVRRQTRGDGLQ